jgi:DNA-binding NarL/FixJ family response regulator
MIKLLIADDHALMREGLKQLFALGNLISVVAEASSGMQVFEVLRRMDVDLVLLDISMPGISGANLINHMRLQEKCPRILVLSMHSELQVARGALSAGASGYLTKDSDPATLIAAVIKVASGGQYMDPRLAEKMAFEVGHSQQKLPHTLLSSREFDIFGRLVRGQSVNDIATELLISNKTVSTYKARLMQKIHCNNNAQLVRYAIDHTLFD